MKPVEIGERFGCVSVIAEVFPRESPHKVVIRCDCGTRKTVQYRSLVTGNTKSCGCAKTTRQNASNTHAAELSIWYGMLKRCYNPKNASYKYYGGRGITVCDRWRESFETFLGDMGSRPNGLTLDRINNDGNYEPSNCKWTTLSVQNSNKRPWGSCASQ